MARTYRIPPTPERFVKEDTKLVMMDFDTRKITITIGVGEQLDPQTGEVVYEEFEEEYVIQGQDLASFISACGPELRKVRDTLLLAVDILRSR